MPRAVGVAVVLTLLANPLGASETVRVSDPDEFSRAAAAARPGDRILLAPGEYGNNFYFRGVHGSAGQAIVIAAADPDWYCEDRTGRSEPRLPTTETDGVAGKDPQFKDAARGNLAVGPDSPARRLGAHAFPGEER